MTYFLKKKEAVSSNIQLFLLFYLIFIKSSI